MATDELTITIHEQVVHFGVLGAFCYPHLLADDGYLLVVVCPHDDGKCETTENLGRNAPFVFSSRLSNDHFSMGQMQPRL